MDKASATLNINVNISLHSYVLYIVYQRNAEVTRLVTTCFSRDLMHACHKECRQQACFEWKGTLFRSGCQIGLIRVSVLLLSDWKDFTRSDALMSCLRS